VLTTGQGLSSNNSFYLGSRALTRQPALVKGLFAALSQADAWGKANLPQTAKFLSEATGVPLAGTLRFLDRRTSGPVTTLKPADIVDQQRVADAFSRAGLIPKSLKVAEAVWQPGSSIA
jgi:sulfonate transport system substrate-binding protein